MPQRDLIQRLSAITGLNGPVCIEAAAEIVRLQAKLAEADNALRGIGKLAESATVAQPVWALPNRVKFVVTHARQRIAR